MRFWLAPLLWTLSACGEHLDVGSNILWSTDHESGDLSNWTQDAEGGAYAHETGTSFAVVSDQARSGKHSVRLTSPANGVDAGPGLFRHFQAPKDAFYSAWYYLPQTHQTVSYWTILRFRPSSPADPANTTLGIDVNLRSLPNGQMTLEIVQQRQAYLHWPLAVPTPIVPIQRWFQLEIRLRNTSDQTGLFKLWLDGVLTYDIEGRVTNAGDDLYFTPCNVTNTLTPAPGELYIDDCMVSRSRITPAGAPTFDE